MTGDDEDFLRRAIQLAIAARADGDAPFGRWAARELAADAAAATTMYTSCQPCRMCTGAIERAGLARVVYGLSNRQLADLNPSGSFPPVPQEGPALIDAARTAVEGYYK